jgi:hypothetical protein
MVGVFWQNPKERSLNQLKASLESMQTSKEGLESELNQELLATLSSRSVAYVFIKWKYTT